MQEQLMLEGWSMCELNSTSYINYSSEWVPRGGLQAKREPFSPSQRLRCPFKSRWPFTLNHSWPFGPRDPSGQRLTWPFWSKGPFGLKPKLALWSKGAGALRAKD